MHDTNNNPQNNGGRTAVPSERARRAADLAYEHQLAREAEAEKARRQMREEEDRAYAEEMARSSIAHEDTAAPAAPSNPQNGRDGHIHQNDGVYDDVGGGQNEQYSHEDHPRDDYPRDDYPHASKYAKKNPQAKNGSKPQKGKRPPKPSNAGGGNGDKPSAKPKRKIGRIIGFTILGLLVVALAVGGVFWARISNPQALFNNDPMPTPTPTPTPTITPVVEDAAISVPTPSPTPDAEAILLSQSDLEFMKNRVNVLVLGVDESTERADWGSFRTDTMILVSIDFETNDVDMISVPRDSYVKICNANGNPTGNYNRINSALSAGGGAQESGYDYAMNTVSYLFGGIPIDYYLGFNMNVVKEIVDAMGGVTYDVDVEINMNGRQILPGVQHMDGQMVLDYCRQRKGDSDIARIDRQQRMLMAIFEQLKDSGQIANLPSIYQAVEENIQTNLSFTQISSLSLLALQMDFEQLSRHSLEGSNLMVGAASCWGLNLNSLDTLIQEVFGVDPELDMEMHASNIRASIEAGQALIATELSSAKYAVSVADTYLYSYATMIDAATVAAMQEVRDELQDIIDDAIDESARDSLIYYTSALNQYNALMQQQLGVQVGSGVQQPAQQQGTVIPEVQVAPTEQDAANQAVSQDPGFIPPPTG